MRPRPWPGVGVGRAFLEFLRDRFHNATEFIACVIDMRWQSLRSGPCSSLSKRTYAFNSPSSSGAMVTIWPSSSPPSSFSTRTCCSQRSCCAMVRLNTSGVVCLLNLSKLDVLSIPWASRASSKKASHWLCSYPGRHGPLPSAAFLLSCSTGRAHL